MTTITKAHAYDFIAQLIEDVEEGFHGTSIEMTEGLIDAARDLFTGEYNAQDDDEDAINDIQWRASNQAIMCDFYNRVTYEMVRVVCDHVSLVIDNGSQSLRIDGSLDKRIVKQILDDLCCERDEYFTREFFERHRSV